MCRAAGDRWLLGRQPVNARTPGQASSRSRRPGHDTVPTPGGRLLTLVPVRRHIGCAHQCGCADQCGCARQYRFATRTTSPPVRLRHQHRFATSAAPPVRRHQCGATSAAPPVRLRHQHRFATRTASPPAPLRHQHHFATSTASPPVRQRHRCGCARHCPLHPPMRFHPPMRLRRPGPLADQCGCADRRGVDPCGCATSAQPSGSPGRFSTPVRWATNRSQLVPVFSTVR